MKKAIKCNVRGTVQGVFFRNFVKENAEKMKLKGFVRNLEDGSVEIFIEGDIDKVDDFCAVCEKGPKHAQIKSVDVVEQPFQDFSDFKILHI